MIDIIIDAIKWFLRGVWYIFDFLIKQPEYFLSKVIGWIVEHFWLTVFLIGTVWAITEWVRRRNDSSL